MYVYANRTNESDTPNIERVAHELECGFDYCDVVDRADHNYTTSWGPVGFKKENHPLALMVKYKRLNLLTHPLVGSLLHHKWNKFGQYGYFINLLTYLVFLAILTTFAFIIENPRSQACITSNMSYNGPEIDCGTSTVQRTFVYISAAVVLILSLCRLLLEGVQFILQFPRYFKDWVNWMEVVLYLSSIIFVCVFGSDCLCPLTWQWQIGVVAVFLGWIDLIVFISKFPLTGIYVLMFIKISQTFLKTLILSALLVFSFGLTFYLTFTQPEILRSPFSTPGRSLLKIMTMTTGEFDFDSIFRQDPTGASDDADEIPFPPISFMLWIVFVIIMPILLTNMLVGLAVGDIGAIQEEAELQKLALQVEQVLTVEEILPHKWRRRFTSGYKVVYPNFKVSWRKQILFLLWGGERYDTRKSLQKVVHASKDENKEKANKLLHQVDSLKTSVNKQVMELKTSICDETEKIEKLLHEVEDLKGTVNGQVEDLKTSIKDIKNLLKQFIETAEA